MNTLPVGVIFVLCTGIGLILGILFDELAFGIIGGAAVGVIIESINRSQRGIH